MNKLLSSCNELVRCSFVSDTYMNSSHTIYVGNIQSLKDDQLRDYFQRFGQIEALYHNCTRAAEEWLIDHRFIRFTSDTDMSVFLTNQVDHMICRIRLDIHPYQVAFRDETRLISDRKICIAHTDSKLNRNVIKKAFTKYGRILNCTCVSSGNGVEYVYIEFESINVVRSITESKQRHFAGRTPLAVEKILRPSQIGAKLECISVNERLLGGFAIQIFRSTCKGTAEWRISWNGLTSRAIPLLRV